MSVTSSPNISPSSKPIIIGAIMIFILNIIISAVISRSIYNKSDKTPEDKAKITLNSFKAFFIIGLIEFVLTALCVLIFKADWWVVFLIGGKIVEFFFHIIAGLFSLIK